MEKPLIVYSNVPAFKEWPTNFKLLFQALVQPTHSLAPRYFSTLKQLAQLISLNLLLGPFRLAMGSRSASHRPKHA